MKTLEDELGRLWNLPKFERTSTELMGAPMILVDGPSFVSQYREIVIEEAYDFSFEGHAPTIVDGGANVGVASLWWRSRWPQARIIAFEPDPQIFKVLSANLRYHPEIELRNAAIAAHRGSATFAIEGSDGGRLVHGSTPSSVVVPTDRLRDLLITLPSVDLLKLDIEGAETAVLLDAAPALSNVHRIFVEYHSFARQRQVLPELLECLRRSGFRYYLDSAIKHSRPFTLEARGHEMDLQTNIWATRVGPVVSG